jgi:hypothetical protein
MRLIDMAHNSAIGTHKSYQSKTCILRYFEESFRTVYRFFNLHNVKAPAKILEYPTYFGPRTI